LAVDALAKQQIQLQNYALDHRHNLLTNGSINWWNVPIQDRAL